jgi:hypothetical protein
MTHLCHKPVGGGENAIVILPDKNFHEALSLAAAGEVMAVVQTAILAGVPYGRLADAVLAHPTMAEGLGMLFSNVPCRSLQHAASERVA